MASTPGMAPSGATTILDENKVKKENYKRHVTSVKIFFAITFFGMVAYIPGIAAYTVVKNHYFISYMYFINHVNNPFIYIAFNKSFRSDVKSLVLKLF